LLLKQQVAAANDKTSLQQVAANGMEVDNEHGSWILVAIVTHKSNDSGNHAVARKCGD
jgi:hypothetical protein